MPDNLQMEQGVASRVAAAQLVGHVLDKRQSIDESLGVVAAKWRLNDDEKRLVHAISGSVFRKLPYIDAVLRRLMTRGADPKPPILHHLLRVGAAQLLYMQVAEHAAVSTCVSAAGSLRLTPQKGVVNAVLRSVQRQKSELLAGQPDALGMLPSWLSERWIANFGPDEALAMAENASQEAPLDLVIQDADVLVELGQMMPFEHLLPDSIRVHHSAGHIRSWPGYTAGSWWVQDLAASLPIKCLADVSEKSILDMCAAPGGKTQQLARAGARVTALDIAPSRMKRVTENLARLRLAHNVQTIVSDARTWEPAPDLNRAVNTFDVVVLDAPCSSTGTLRRHPEHPWIHDKNDIEKLGEVQRDLLCRAAGHLSHDGILLYCTCSCEPEEGENQIDSFLNQNKDFIQITQIPAVVHPYLKPGLRHIGFRTDPRVLQGKGGLDGFFIALLKKI